MCKFRDGDRINIWRFNTSVFNILMILVAVILVEAVVPGIIVFNKVDWTHG